jgi:3-deoxy-D-manno-octulosonate 8-phosphate phosphatase (KDO 8-P phosphatase)
MATTLVGRVILYQSCLYRSIVSRPSSSADLPIDFSVIDAISFDVDGVLTDGGITYSDDGRELKTFNVQDGAAIRLLLDSGIHVALITGRSSPIVSRRAAELGVNHIFQGQQDKRAAFMAFLGATGTSPERSAHVGDDLADIPLFTLAGLGIGVPNAHPSVRLHAGFITETAGGGGVARELTELILRARGIWQWD